MSLAAAARSQATGRRPSNARAARRLSWMREALRHAADLEKLHRRAVGAASSAIGGALQSGSGHCSLRGGDSQLRRGTAVAAEQALQLRAHVRGRRPSAAQAPPEVCRGRATAGRPPLGAAPPTWSPAPSLGSAASPAEDRGLLQRVARGIARHTRDPCQEQFMHLCTLGSRLAQASVVGCQAQPPPERGVVFLPLEPPRLGPSTRFESKRPLSRPDCRGGHPDDAGDQRRRGEHTLRRGPHHAEHHQERRLAGLRRPALDRQLHAALLPKGACCWERCGVTRGDAGSLLRGCWELAGSSSLEILDGRLARTCGCAGTW